MAVQPVKAVRVRTAEGWQDIALVGPAGPQGAAGALGPEGPQGAAGLGVPAGGATGQALTKRSASDNDTQWSTIAAGTPPVVTSLPGSPTAGQEVYLRAPDAQALWHLKWNNTAPSGYKWEFVGGQPMAKYASSSVSAPGAPYTTFIATGLGIALPNAGQYIFWGWIRMQNLSASAAVYSVEIAKTSASPPQGPAQYTLSIPAGFDTWVPFGPIRATVAAADVWDLWVKCTTDLAYGYAHRQLFTQPLTGIL